MSKDFRRQRRHKRLKGEFGVRLCIGTFGTRLRIRKNQASRIVMSFPCELLAKQFVAPGVRSTLELREDPEMRLRDRNRPHGSGNLLKKDEVTKPRSSRRLEHPFSIGRPDVGSASKSFFSPI